MSYSNISYVVYHIISYSIIYSISYVSKIRSYIFDMMVLYLFPYVHISQNLLISIFIILLFRVCFVVFFYESFYFTPSYLRSLQSPNRRMKKIRTTKRKITEAQASTTMQGFEAPWSVVFDLSCWRSPEVLLLQWCVLLEIAARCIVQECYFLGPFILVLNIILLNPYSLCAMTLYSLNEVGGVLNNKSKYGVTHAPIAWLYELQLRQLELTFPVTWA